MEIIDFSEQEWIDIDPQDNPACDQSGQSERCLMLVKTSNFRMMGPKAVSVFDVRGPDEDLDNMIPLGHFHSKENALLFANYFSEVNS